MENFSSVTFYWTTHFSVRMVAKSEGVGHNTNSDADRKSEERY